MKRILLVLLICLPLCGNAATTLSADYYFSRIDGEAGLSQNNVKSIIQDSYGFVWLGTRNRLNRYDGTSMKVFDCYDPVQGRRNNNISALFEDKERQLWVGTDKGIFRFNPVDETFTFFNAHTAGHIQITDWVADITEDLDGNIWIVIPNQGLFRYHTASKQLFHYSIGTTEMPDRGNPQCICVEQKGRVWVGTNGGGVCLYDRATDSFTTCLGDSNGSSLKNENIYTMCDFGEELVLGIHEGKLRKFNKRKNRLTDVNAPDVHYKIIRHVVNIDGELWVGTQDGLFVINELADKVLHIKATPMFALSLSDNVVEKIYRDKEGGVWLGTLFGGASYLAKKSIAFDFYAPMRANHTLNSRHLREMQEDTQGNIWIATEDAELNIFNPRTKKFTRIGSAEGLSIENSKIVLGLLLDENEAWVGLFKNGLDVIQLSNHRVRHYSGTDLKIDEASVYAICEDHYGNIWLGNGWNVYKGNKQTKAFVRMDVFGLNYIYDIIEDATGTLWVATLGNGVYQYNPLNGQLRHYSHDMNDPSSLGSNSVSSITETSLGEIWLSTDRGGICHYNKATDNFTSYSLSEGLPDDVAYKIVEDKNHQLWFGTNKGLVRFNPQTKDVKVFSNSNGLPFNEFNYKSAVAAGDGMFYFGGLNGLIAFDPNSYEANTFVPPVYITQLSINNTKQSINHTDKVALKYNQSNIGFDFVALSYTAPQANKYAYKMEGLDDDWTYTSNSHSAFYAKLPSGKYVFRVKGSNNDDLWNQAGTSLEIEILPPWWFSSWAILGYFILLILLLYAIIEQTKRRYAEKRQLYEAAKEKELYDSKMEFFTNIAHEIRTPVTLINGPLEAMLEMDIQEPELKKSLGIMGKNTAVLLNLINQLLDFRKVDSNKFTLNFATHNLSEIVKSIYARFEPAAQREMKTMRLLLPPEEVQIEADRSAMDKILNNLFSNALHYSDAMIEVELFLAGDDVCIRVRNDGNLIPAHERAKIFDPFYRGNQHSDAVPGSGIGLSLAHSLAELHEGALYYQEAEEMNEFVLRLPLKQPTQAAQPLSAPDDIVAEPGYNTEKSNVELILIVEDNEEMLAFIADKLQKHFAVAKARNGAEALKFIEEKNVDLLLSDVMMPEMDGFELCQSIKGNLDYSHIPVVLLTAKNDLDSKIHGLEMGADAYVEKPFSMSHLLTQLTTLLSNRRREKEAFMRKPFLPIQNIGMNKADEEFMEKLIAIIQEHITNPNFSVETLSEKLSMSRSNLHRKIKALTELAPIDFIRLIRLKKAAELIQSGKYRVGEICYLVGINSSSYFIRLFQKQFGVTPKEFVKQITA
ncbi:hybrid sensor histidine kinase/response regulator [Bacteroidia bacterium]|nr:hybrid sensor histidine kinase/response regulator [Bacteroidia bacterium]